MGLLQTKSHATLSEQVSNCSQYILALEKLHSKKNLQMTQINIEWFINLLRCCRFKA